MARTPSVMIPLGSKAPEFTLQNTMNGEIASLNNLKGEKATVIMFICNHCPFVKHLHAGFVSLINDYQDKEISFIAISSNDVDNFPEDSPELMKQLFSELGINIPYLYDKTQEVAKAYDAACTPDFYVYDNDLSLVYRGQFDSSRPGNGIQVTGEDLRGALDAILKDEAVSEDQLPSLGCNIKWK